MKAVRAMTLIEVLVSIVLLTMLAVACVPLIRDVAQPNSDDAIPLHELSTFADNVMAEPEQFGIEQQKLNEPVELSWAEHAEREPIRLVRVDTTTTDAPATHAWLLFTCGAHTVIRYLALESVEEGSP